MGSRDAKVHASGPLGAVVVSLVVAAAGLAVAPVAGVASPPDAGGTSAEVGCPAGILADPASASAEGLDAALELAAACGVAVEDMSARGFDTRSMAQPSGTVRTEAYAVPRWAKDESGRWVDIDTNLVRRPDGTIRPAAIVGQVSFSGGGEGPLAVLTSPDGEHRLSLTWPGALPVPRLVGDAAVYENVLPDVDLQVVAHVDGFSYSLLVQTTQAAADPRLERIAVELAADGLEIGQDPQGRVVVDTAAGEPVFVSGPALMWDSSVATAVANLPPGELGGLTVEDLAPGRLEPVRMDLVGNRLVVVPDPQLLADAAAGNAQFPVVIDPDFHSVGKSAWATVHEEQPDRGWTNDSAWPREGGIRMGLCDFWDCYDATGVWRGVMKFDTSPLAGRYILSAAVKMTQTHTAGCGTYVVQLWNTSTIKNSSSWNSVTWRSKTAEAEVPSSHTCGTGKNQAFKFDNNNVRNLVQDYADDSASTISFGVRSNSESNSAQWRRVSASSLKLEVEHASYPQKPKNQSTSGKGCGTEAPGVYVTTGRPKLSAEPRNDDGKGRLYLRVRGASGTTDLYTFRSDVVTVNTTVSHTLPSTATLPDGSYRWQSRTESADSGVPASSWASYCYFTVDTTPPPPPTAQQLTENPVQGDPVTFRLTGSSDTAQFRYNLSGGPNTTVTASGGTATITVTPPTTSIDHQLQVWAIDVAGNLSARYDLWFATGKPRPIPHVGVWRFDGDWLDDSGEGHHLTPTAAAGFGTDREGRTLSALALDGASCARADGPVLRTDQSFTIAAWAKPIDAGGTPVTIASQGGADNTAFRLRRWGSTDKWAFLMLDADSSDATWYSIQSLSTATGQWQHVAGVFDAAADRMRLYVDGVLQGEVDAPSGWASTGPLVIGCASSDRRPSWDQFTGFIDDVVAYQGVLTQPRILELMAGGPPAGEVSWWPMRGNGEDSGPGGHTLTVPAGVTWVADSHGRGGSAMSLDGASCAVADGPVVRSDNSFTVAAWVKPGDAGNTRTRVLSQAGQFNTSFRLSRTESQNWGFNLVPADSTTGAWVSVYAPSEVYTGGWQHLVGVYDAAEGEIRLYVDGVLQGEAAAPASMWRAAGPLHIGCAASSQDTWEHFVGAVHDVRVWRGAATPEQINSLALELKSYWALDESTGGDDAWGNNDLTFHGTHKWVEDRFGECFAAYGLELDGNGYAQTGGPVVVTDESFTVSVWAKLDDKSAKRTVVSQAGDAAVPFSLTYSPELDRWQFSMSSADDPTPEWHWVTSSQSPQVGVWYHLVATFDLGAGELSLYVNGELQGRALGPRAPWHTDGPFLVGTAGDTGGGRWNPMVGAIDQVRVYAGVLDEHRIADQGIRPTVPLPPGECDFFG